MAVTRLTVSNFRNIESAELRPSAKLNIIYGENGSGKTTLLEGLSTLSSGRSFRSRKYTNLIRYQQTAFSLFCEVVGRGDNLHRIGIERSRARRSQFKVDGAAISSSIELARLVPLQVINANSFQLLEGGPSQRRRFLDWLVFHVKHDFGRIWSDYARCLKQRNSLLRRDKIAPAELQPWDEELARLGELLDESRVQCIESYLPEFNNYLSQCDFALDGDFSVQYVPGWDRSKALLQQYRESFERDRRVGYTTIGPHKSDLRIAFNKKPVEELFSRGQQKSVVSALYLAQLKTFQILNQTPCILLVDDLPAELDTHNKRRLIRWVADLDIQTFITGINLSDLKEGWPQTQLESGKVFHVKHGQVIEQPIVWSSQ